MTEGPNNGIILYHYSFSPYARRVIWYLALRGIDYAECKQPPVMPRPDLQKVGVNYRRIPLMAIGRDVYCDTRIMLRKLEDMFPDGRLGASEGDQKVLEKLLETWTVESGIFNRASQLIPADMPLLKDEGFKKDREDLSGRSWSREDILKFRPEALSVIRSAFKLLETTLLADGRDWVLKTEKPTLADIEAVWPFDWLNGLKGALPSSLISEKQYPNVYAWMARFNKELSAARGKAPKPTGLKGEEAAQRIMAAKFVDRDIGVDSRDPLGLRPGQQVEVWPIDSGFNSRDAGSLVGLSDDEVVVSKGIGKSVIRVHFPRSGFRIVPVENRPRI